MKVNSSNSPLQSLIDSEYQTAHTYAAYRLMIHQLHEKNKVTGPKQSQALFEYSRLNEQRMNRLDKHFAVRPDLSKAVIGVKKKYTWLVITEGWCGDAAQLLPAIEKMSFLNYNISTRYILRDEHTDIMDMFLVNNTRAIPVLVCIDENHQVIWHWGPRPLAGQLIIDACKKKGMDSEASKEELHTWYAQDKLEAFQTEIIKLVKKM